MKIGYVLKIFPKISETFVINEIVELIRMGHEVYIFSIYDPNKKIINSEKIIHEEVLEYDLLSKTHYAPYIYRLILELSGYVSLALDHHPNNMLHNKLCTDVANHFANIIREKDLKLDIIHAHFATEQTFIAMKLSKMLGVPFTLMAHANDIFVNPDIKSLKQKFESAVAVITPSYYNRDYIHVLTGISKDKIFVVRACPNMDEIKSLTRNEEEFTILSISRLVEKKGIKYGILAIKELTNEYPKIKYKIIGSGPLNRELNDIIRSLKIDDNVEMIGNLDDKSLMNELSKATIFILPCLETKNGDMDGIPVSLMESMYVQIPTISTNISGIPELIENGKNGLLVDSRDINQLTDAMRLLLANKDLRNKIGNNGRQKIEKDFNIHKEVKKLTEIWNKAI